MKLDDLKNSWNQKVEIKEQQEPGRPAGMTLADELKKLDSKVRWGAWLEIVVGVFIFVALAVALIQKPDMIWLVKLGAGVIMASCLLVINKFCHGLKFKKPEDLTVHASVLAEIQKLESWNLLNLSALYWYVLPLGIGVLLALYGGHLQRTGSYALDLEMWLMLVAYLAFCAAVVWSGKSEAKRKIEPKLAQLRQIQQQLSEQ